MPVPGKVDDPSFGSGPDVEEKRRVRGFELLPELPGGDEGNRSGSWGADERVREGGRGRVHGERGSRRLSI